MTWKILIIDDDEEDFLIAKDMLKEAKGRRYDVHWASTFLAGSEALHTNHFQAVLVDYDLGSHTGIELIREANQRGYAAPFILFTGRGSYDVDVEAMEAGATLYLTKGEANPLLLERSIRYAIELKQKEQALMLSEERYRRLVQNANEGIWTIDANYMTDFINRRGAEILGYTAEEMFGRPALDFLFSEDTPSASQKLEDRKLGVSETVDIRMRHKDGHEVWVRSSSTPILSDQGQFLGALAMFEDITARKGTEKDLHEILERTAWLARLPDENPNPVVRVTVSGHVLYHNRSAAQAVGWNCALGQRLPDVLLPLVTQAMERGHEVRGDVIIDGHDYSVSIMPITKENYANIYGRDITDRKLVEKALRESEQRYSALFHAKTNGIAHCRVITDEHGLPIDYEILQVNEAYEAITGIKRADIEGRRARDVFPGIENFTFDYIGNYGQVALHGGELNFETFFEATRQWQSIYIYSPKPGEFTAIFTDISQRKQAEMASQTSEGLLEALLAHSPGILNILDEQFRYIKTDPITPTYFGLDRRSIIGKDLADLAPEFIENFGPMFRRVLETGQPEQNMQVHNPFPDRADEMTYWQASYFQVPLPGGEKGIGIMGIEVTEQKKAEQAWQQSEQHLSNVNLLLQGVIEGTPDLIAAVDKELRFLAVNSSYQRAFKEVFGVEVRAGMSIIETLAHLPEDFQNAKDLWGRALQGERFVITSEFGDPSYKRRLFDMRFYPIRDSEGGIIAAGEVSNDVTERMEMEKALQTSIEKLARSNEELVQFALIASHELQEPLRKIKQFGKLLQPEIEGKLDAESQDRFDRMLHAMDRMLILIQDLLNLARVTNETRPFVAVDLSQVAADVVSDLETLIQRTKGQVIIGQLPVIEADPFQIHQVLQNVIGNALKFHKPDSPPVVKVSSDILMVEGQADQMMVLRVEDNGIGFNEAQFEQTLQPFLRLQGRSEYEGTGIGLAIVKKIVDRHQGGIMAQSKPGEGSTFLITLPIKQVR